MLGRIIREAGPSIPMNNLMRLSPVLVLSLAVLAACTAPNSHSEAQTSKGGLLSSEALTAPNRAPPPDLATMKMSFAPVVKRVAPAVVNISSKRVVRAQPDPFFEFFGGGMPREQVQGSLGSGVIVRADGIILTNNHVVEGGQEITVGLADRREFPAKLILSDSRADLAVLKIDTKGERLPVLPIADRDAVQVGDLVLAVGDPFGVGQTVTNGIVSALARTDVGQGFGAYIQTDAAINPGNSGGPLVDMNGNLIGINTFILSRSGSSAGVGFAIPAALVRRVVETAVGGGKSLEHTWLGLQVKPVTAEIAAARGLAVPQGAVVTAVYPGGPAARAGVAVGDILLKADNESLNDEAGLNYVAATHKPGDEMNLTLGGGRGRVLQVRLTTPPSTPKDERTLAGRQPLGGATVVNLSPATAENLGLNPFTTGVVVEKVQGLAARLGFQAGDLVLSVNGKTITNTANLADALAGASSWRVVIDRDGQKIVAEF